MGEVRNKLLEIRLSKGYKRQQDFADFLEVDRTQYNKYENNKIQPNIAVALQISEKLGIPINDFIYLKKD